MIKVIIFDFGGVLGSNADEWDTSQKNILQETGLNFSELDEIFDAHWQQLKIGKEKMKDFWKAVAKKSKNSTNYQKLRNIYNNGHKINNKVLNLARSLKGKYPLAIFMNTSDDEAKSKINNFGLKEVFDNIFDSSTMGIAKPDKNSFLFVLKQLNVSPSQVLFIDNQRNNYDAATEIGINTILYNNPQQLKKDIESYINK